MFKVALVTRECATAAGESAGNEFEGLFRGGERENESERQEGAGVHFFVLASARKNNNLSFFPEHQAQQRTGSPKPAERLAVVLACTVVGQRLADLESRLTLAAV